MLKPYYHPDVVEAGCDEAGRGCLCGCVFAAAVILPHDYANPQLNDSKQLSPHRRYALRTVIEHDALAWAVATASPYEIDHINILRASVLAMHRALSLLALRPEAVIVDGNRFSPFRHLPYATLVKGDARYMSIAAASILAKTYRDDYMQSLAREFPDYDWQHNMGYPTARHRAAVRRLGPTPYHRLTFNLTGNIEPELPFGE